MSFYKFQFILSGGMSLTRFVLLLEQGHPKIDLGSSGRIGGARAGDEGSTQGTGFWKADGKSI